MKKWFLIAAGAGLAYWLFARKSKVQELRERIALLVQAAKTRVMGQPLTAGQQAALSSGSSILRDAAALTPKERAELKADVKLDIQASVPPPFSTLVMSLPFVKSL